MTSIEVGRNRESFEINLVAGGNFGGFTGAPSTTPPLPPSDQLSSPSDPNHPSHSSCLEAKPQTEQNTKPRGKGDRPEDFVASLALPTPLNRYLRPQRRDVSIAKWNCVGIDITRHKWRGIRASWDIHSFSPPDMGNKFE